MICTLGTNFADSTGRFQVLMAGTRENGLELPNRLHLVDVDPNQSHISVHQALQRMRKSML